MKMQCTQKEWDAAKDVQGQSSVFRYTQQQVRSALAENLNARKNAKPLCWSSDGEHLRFDPPRQPNHKGRPYDFASNTNYIKFQFAEGIYAATRNASELAEEFPVYQNVGQICGYYDCFNPAHLVIEPKEMTAGRVDCNNDQLDLCFHSPLCERKSQEVKELSVAEQLEHPNRVVYRNSLVKVPKTAKVPTVAEVPKALAKSKVPSKPKVSTKSAVPANRLKENVVKLKIAKTAKKSKAITQDSVKRFLGESSNNTPNLYSTMIETPASPGQDGHEDVKDEDIPETEEDEVVENSQPSQSQMASRTSSRIASQRVDIVQPITRPARPHFRRPAPGEFLRIPENSWRKCVCKMYKLSYTINKGGESQSQACFTLRSLRVIIVGILVTSLFRLSS